MKIVNFLLILILTLADLAIHGIEASLFSRNELEKNDDRVEEFFSTQNVHYEPNRFNLFRLKKRTKRSKHMTCKRAPRMCRAKGSPGPTCCKKKCVNVLTDRRNCGKCGKRCKYNKICCNGKCVNPNYNKAHCGGCNNSCSNGGLCAFGLCNYG